MFFKCSIFVYLYLYGEERVYAILFLIYKVILRKLHLVHPWNNILLHMWVNSKPYKIDGDFFYSYIKVPNEKKIENIFLCLASKSQVS